jgi:Flp pilus assembly protein TadD
MRIAQEALNKGNLPMAASFLQRAHDTHPEAPEPLIALADIFKHTGQYEPLAKVQQVLIALQPNDPELAIDYGLSLLRLGHQTDARIQLHTALEKSDAPRIYNALGVTYDMDGDHRSAQAYYRIALENDRGYLSAMGNLGLSLALSGDIEESLAILDRLVADPASETKHREILAAVHAVTGDLEAAGKAAGRAFDAAAAERAMKHYGLTPSSGEDADNL